MRIMNFRHYFIQSKNPGEQFYLFTSLAAWLIRQTGRSFDPPQEYDDPNSTISNIIEITKIMVSLYRPILYEWAFCTKNSTQNYFCMCFLRKILGYIVKNSLRKLSRFLK